MSGPYAGAPSGLLPKSSVVVNRPLLTDTATFVIVPEPVTPPVAVSNTAKVKSKRPFASPFVVLFAVETLQGGVRATGTFLFARITGFVLSTMLWQRISRRRGDSTVLRISAIAAGVAALLAAAVAFASPWSLDWIPASGI